MKNDNSTENSAWNEAKAIDRLNCPPELIMNIASLFLRDGPDQLQQIENAIAARDYESTRIAAHSLFGTSTHFCTSSFESTCQNLQGLLKQQDWQQAEHCFAQLQREYDELVKELSEFIARHT